MTKEERVRDFLEKYKRLCEETGLVITVCEACRVFYICPRKKYLDSEVKAYFVQLAASHNSHVPQDIWEQLDGYYPHHPAELPAPHEEENSPRPEDYNTSRD